MNLSNNLDYSIGSCDERIKYVNEVIENHLDKLTPKDGELSELGNKITYTLEKLGTYIIQSNDIKSERRVDKSFYRTEKNYRQTAMGRHTETVDFESREDLHNLIDEGGGGQYSQEYLSKLFNFASMSDKEKYRVIKYGLPEKGGETQLAPIFDYVYDLLIEACENDTDKQIIECLVHNLSQTDIGLELHISQQAVYKRIKKLIDTAF